MLFLYVFLDHPSSIDTWSTCTIVRALTQPTIRSHTALGLADDLQIIVDEFSRTNVESIFAIGAADLQLRTTGPLFSQLVRADSGHVE